ncbi:sperm-egg fusion protein LLCFC1 [Erinaceus europaeus]|uniref:Sperm-egg fusion protein LLCFC1 n=1 Tax=Erinaceus europaeus TaxID=9365 RepID=A0A1S2ZP66_ERIEU|nr:sperm-egg fusion protein LLCFC1 [Erinaceus europaeus]
MTSLGTQLCRAVLLASILLLLWAKGVRPQNEDQDSEGEAQKDNLPSIDQDQEQLEEHFLASSVGEMWQVVDMAQQEDQEMSQAREIHNHLFDLAFCFNLASILVFL